MGLLSLLATSGSGQRRKDRIQSFLPTPLSVQGHPYWFPSDANFERAHALRTLAPPEREALLLPPTVLLFKHRLVLLVGSQGPQVDLWRRWA